MENGKSRMVEIEMEDRRSKIEDDRMHIEE
jgi:hypothetical protein